MNDRTDKRLADKQLEMIVAGGSGASQACGALRSGAALCDQLGLGNNQKPARRRKSRKK